MRRYTVGQGFTPQAKTSAPEWNHTAETYFNHWAQGADLLGQLSFADLLGLWCMRVDEDGDVGVLLTQNRFGRPKLQTIESHRIGNGSVARGQFFSDYPDGVKVDDQGRPKRYLVDGERSISARDFILVFDTTRAQQTRGIPALSHAIDNLFDIKEVLAYEKRGIKINSAIAMAIKTRRSVDDDDEGFLGKIETVTEADDITLENMTDGVIPRLAPEEDITAHRSDRPNATFQGFINHFIRDFAAGIGLPFEFIFNPEKLGGTSQRFILAKAERAFAERQRLLINRVCNRVWGWVISKAVKSGELTFNPEWHRVHWQTPRRITVDTGRDTKSEIDALKMGLTTFSEIHGGSGHDWEEQLRQRAREESIIQQIADEHGVSPERISQRSPNPVALSEPSTDQL